MTCMRHIPQIFCSLTAATVFTLTGCQQVVKPAPTTPTLTAPTDATAPQQKTVKSI